MILITGPLYSGKENWIRRRLSLTEEAFAACAVRDVQELVPCPDPEKLVAGLRKKKIVICTETGCGVIPIDPGQREKREAAGRLSCRLAEEADTVVRVCCGLPQLLKGEWP